MRLFIAIELPKKITDELESIQTKLDTDITRQTFSKQHHLTLKFLGESDPEQIKPILEKISFEPFEISLSNIGVFPNENYIKVVWIGITPTEHIVKLQKQIEDYLRPLNIKQDHEFHPHITLSRVKFIKDKDQFKKLLKMTPKQIKFKVNSFKLIRSELTPEGPKYTELASFQ